MVVPVLEPVNGAGGRPGSSPRDATGRNLLDSGTRVRLTRAVTGTRGQGLDARVVDLPGRHHFSAVDALGDTRQPLFAAVRDLILGEG